MRVFSKLLMSAAGIGMIASAAPAAAQSAPYGSYGYGQTQNGGVIGAVIDSVLGGGRYGAYGQGNDRIAVDQCARAAEARVSADFRASRYGAYNQGYGNAYAYGNQRYGNSNGAVANARVVGITGVVRKSSGLKVTGVIDSGMGYNRMPGQAYGSQGYDPRYSQGYDPRYSQGYDPRYSQGYDPRYGQGYDPRYGNQQGYDPRYGNQAYGNNGYNAQMADLRFDCRVNYRGMVTSVEIKRNMMRRPG